MPFTPFHMGPALALKAFLGRSFSVTVFGIAQIAMDIEPLIRLLRGDSVVHGLTHTYLGATLIGALVALIGKPPGQLLLRIWNIATSGSSDRSPLRVSPDITWIASISGALIGTLSHVLLDSLMHRDMQPWWPLATGNAMVGLVSRGTLHLGCVVAGCLGVVVIAVVSTFRE